MSRLQSTHPSRTNPTSNGFCRYWWDKPAQWLLYWDKPMTPPGTFRRKKADSSTSNVQHQSPSVFAVFLPTYVIEVLLGVAA